jgi:hypothetical protein
VKRCLTRLEEPHGSFGRDRVPQHADPSTSTSTTSPGLSGSFGSRAQPTSGGVSVRMRSPGSSVNVFETYATRYGTEKIMAWVLPS